ncbi:MAG TPA: hypothetical protein VMT80_00325 [Candidatus Paceibacterota bacterium]|nr:hypothetical protein [Candidatus Paceibacterota bacterium]
MPDAPLQPFSAPSFVHLVAPSVGSLLGWFLVFILGCWAVYTLIAIYHWIRYSHNAAFALPAIATHLIVSLACVSYALSGTL